MRRRHGKSDVEYCLIIALVVLVTMPLLNFLGQVIASFYLEKNGISQGAELFALLNPKSQPKASQFDAPDGIAALENGTVIYTDNQPVKNVVLDYENDHVKMIVPDLHGVGTYTTSADGTLQLARNLTHIQEETRMLSETQYQELMELSELGLNMAEEQRRLVESYPEFETNPDAVPPLGLFSGEGLYQDYKKFHERYQSLASQLPEDDPRIAGIRTEIDANAAVISQVAFYNFLAPQAKLQASEAQKKEIVEKLVIANVDVGQVQANTTSDTPGSSGQAAAGQQSAQRPDASVLTQDASTRMKDLENRYQRLLRNSNKRR